MKKDTTSKVKFKRLQRSLKLSSWQAVGLLESVWHCATTNAPAGDIGKLTNEDIASAIEWDGDADALIAALVDCDWLDIDDEFRLVVHNWSKHVPTYLKGAFEKHHKKFADEVISERAKHCIEQTAKDGAKDTAKHNASDGAGEGASYPSLSHPSLEPIQAEPIQVKPAAAAVEEKLPASIDTPEMQVAWKEWVQYRKEIKKALTPTQRIKQLNKFARKGLSWSLVAIENTIEHGWIGILHPDEQGGARGSPTKISDPRGNLAVRDRMLADARLEQENRDGDET